MAFAVSCDGAAGPPPSGARAMSTARRRRRDARQPCFAILPALAASGITDVVVEDCELIPKVYINELRKHFVGRVRERAGHRGGRGSGIRPHVTIWQASDPPAERIAAIRMQDATPEELRSAAEWLRQWYYDNNYKLNDVLLKKAPSGRDRRVVYTARERRVRGVRFEHKTAGGTTKAGTGRTRPQVVLKTLGLEVGKHFCMPEERFSNLQVLELFDDVQMKPERIEDDGVYLLIELFEQAFMDIAPAFSLSRHSGGVGTIAFNDRNFRGRGQRLSFSGSRSQTAGYEAEVSLIDPRFEGGSVTYSWSLKVSGKPGSPPRTGIKVAASTPMSKALDLVGSCTVQRQRSEEAEGVIQAEADARIINDRRLGSEVKKGHRAEIGAKRGLSYGDNGAITNIFWGAHARLALFSAALANRLGLIVGVEGNLQGDSRPGLKEYLWQGGEVRGLRTPMFASEAYWVKTLAEARLPVHKNATMFVFAESARSERSGSIGSAGIGARFLGSICCALTVQPNGEWQWRLLPVDTNF